MKIGINSYEAVVPRFGHNKKTGLPNRVGSSEFCFQLLSKLSKIDTVNEYSVLLPVEPSSDMPKETEKWKYVVIQSKKLWTLLGLSRKLKNYKLDVFFSPTHYLPLYTSSPSVISIFDVSYLYFPNLFKKKDLYQLKLWGGYSIKKAQKIITISNSSKNDIIKMYKVNPDKVTVIYPGIKIQNSEFTIQNMEELKKKFGIDSKYILFVGTLQPRKNIIKLIEAFAKLKEKDFNLVIVGKKGWHFEEILNAPKKYNVEDRVKFLDSVSDEDLPGFYKNALCFCLPSLYEGFGLPILEAMQYGCPVATSNVSSLPEAGGDAVVYFDPENVEDITKALHSLVNDEELRNKLVKKGYEQIKKFSWEKTARETLKVLEEVGNKHE